MPVIFAADCNDLIGCLQTPHIQGTQPQFQMAAQPVGNGIKTEAPMLGASGGASNIPSTHKILDRKRLQDLVKEIDPNTQLEDDVEEVEHAYSWPPMLRLMRLSYELCLRFLSVYQIIQSGGIYFRFSCK